MPADPILDPIRAHLAHRCAVLAIGRLDDGYSALWIARALDEAHADIRALLAELERLKAEHGAEIQIAHSIGWDAALGIVREAFERIPPGS